MTKTWLITGSARGVGRELAKAALDSGDQVVASARCSEPLVDLVAEYGDRVRVVDLDVTDVEAARAAVRTAVREFGSLDVVVNNAGSAVSSPIAETSQETFRAELETNLFGMVNVTKAALPVLHAQGSGCFVQFSSIGGRVGGTPGLGAYQTAKFAVEGFSEVLSNEVRPLGIKVIIVEPGGVEAGYDSGDPVRAATIITNVLRLDDPPLRLLLGSDALALADESSRARAAEAKKWAVVSRSADLSRSLEEARAGMS
jgi:NAD(P)-dependent dehydrogenase (short-subunit alcohol dehydrogenase family)